MTEQLPPIKIPTSIQILLVDDHPLFREGMAISLKRLADEVTVLEAANGREGLALVDECHKVDLILVDLGMPDMDGFDFLAGIDEKGIKVPVAVISGTEDASTMRKALAAGALSFLGKSLPRDQLLEALDQTLKGQSWTPTALRAQLVVEQTDVPELSRRQTQILECLNEGMSNKQVSDALHISEHTVKFHLASLYRLLNVNNRTECLSAAMRVGLIS